MVRVELDGVTVGPTGAPRLADVSLTVGAGEFVGLVGESGSGKSSLLRAIAGLDRLAAGRVRFDDVDVTAVDPAGRDIGFVFQHPALIGHRSVGRNLSFPLEMRRRSVAEIRERVGAEARALHIEALLLRRPSELSAGEQQMVQIARALVRPLRVLLLDEPFALLDEMNRHRMRGEMGLLHDGYGLTTLIATNDPLDVTALTTSVAVLEEGRIVQFAATAEVRRAPETLFAAAATGTTSELEATVSADASGFWLVRDDPAGGEAMRIRAWTPALASHVGARVAIALRPEHVVLDDGPPDRGVGVAATVERHGVIPAAGLQCTVAGAQVIATGGDRRRVTAGDRVRLRIEQPLVFDPATGRAIR